MANGAVSALMHKVACESLGIKNSAILDEELKKKESLVDAFVSGVGPKKIGTPATPQLAWPRGPGSVVVWLSRAGDPCTLVIIFLVHEKHTPCLRATHTSITAFSPVMFTQASSSSPTFSRDISVVFTTIIALTV
jgi:hypothetical protein